MLNKFTPNNSSSKSSRGIFDYLSKEDIQNENDLVESLDKGFFSNDFNLVSNRDTNYSVEFCVQKLDYNLSTNHKVDESSFYMLNLSPSQKELNHLEVKASEILEEQNIFLVEDASPDGIKFYEEQKEQVINLLLKDYVSEVMDVYADNFNREVYVDQNNLPTKFQNEVMNKEINRQFDELLVSAGLKDAKNEVIHNDLIIKNTIDKPLQNKVTIEAKIVKENAKSSLISIQKNGQEYRFLVNNSSIISKNTHQITFKNKSQLEYLIDKSIQRDEAEKKLVEIKFEKIETKIESNTKDGSDQKVYIFYQKHEGLKEPLVIKVLEKDLIKDNGKYLLEHYKLQYKIESQIKIGIKNEYSGIKEEIKHKVWTDKGFNPETRKLAKEDLLYFAKIENNRAYKGSNTLDRKKIQINLKVQVEIDALLVKSEGKETKEIKALKESLIRDKYTGEVIKEGVQKGGNQKHVHVVVSKFDQTNPPHLKNSLSPLSNSKGDKLEKGFNRHEFNKKIEQVFDQKFEYIREIEQKYEYKNTLKNHAKGEVKSFVISQVTKEIQKEMNNPIQQIKQDYNPVAILKRELNFVPLPTSLPKGKIDLVMKIGKFMLRSAEKGMGM